MLKMDVATVQKMCTKLCNFLVGRGVKSRCKTAAVSSKCIQLADCATHVYRQKSQLCEPFLGLFPDTAVTSSMLSAAMSSSHVFTWLMYLRICRPEYSVLQSVGGSSW